MCANIGKDIENCNNTMNQLSQSNVYGILPPTMEYVLFSGHGIFTMTDQTIIWPLK